MAKMINYGIAYGLSDFGLADRLKIPREEAQKFIADYFEAYPGIRRYTIEIRMLARDQGFVSTLLGRRRYLPELTARNSRAPLGGGADGDQHADPGHGGGRDEDRHDPARRRAARRGGCARCMLLQVHDELVFETDEDELPALATLAQRGDGDARSRSTSRSRSSSRWAPTGSRWTDTSARPTAAGSESGGAGAGAGADARRARRVRSSPSTGADARAARGRDRRPRPAALGRRRHDRRGRRPLGADDRASAAGEPVRSGAARGPHPPRRTAGEERPADTSPTGG